MLPVPEEFDPSQIALKSEAGAQMYRAELATKRSDARRAGGQPGDLLCTAEASPASGASGNLSRGPTTTRPRETNIPIGKTRTCRSQKDIERLRADMRQWGYCKIEDALSAEQVANIR